jgi:predicted RNA binding protein YcfA (HicA-like mRNA interferase family)
MPARARDVRQITGPQLIALLTKDGWQAGRVARHGQSLRKRAGDRTLVTVIPTKTEPLPAGTLAAILGPKQTQLGKAGLSRLLERHGRL